MTTAVGAGLIMLVDCGEDLDDVLRVRPHIVMICANTPRIPVLRAPVLISTIAVKIKPHVTARSIESLSKFGGELGFVLVARAPIELDLRTHARLRETRYGCKMLFRRT